MAAPRPLIDDVTAEILLRLPPGEPEQLFRAALVCKPWLRIICDPGFRRRYREFHCAPLPSSASSTTSRCTKETRLPASPPPRRFQNSPTRDPTAAARAPSTAATAASSSTCWKARAGVTSSGTPSRATDTALPEPDIEWLIHSAAVLCAADGCDHLDCHGGPLRVVFAATHDCKYIVASVYSSETGEWDEPGSLDNTCEVYAKHMREVNAAETYLPYYTPYLQPRRGTLVGDAVYFTLWRNNAIVKYDLGEDYLSMIDAPPTTDLHYVTLMAMESNSLGFACIQGSSLCMWSRNVDTEEAAEWVHFRVMELEKTIPVANPDGKRWVVGFAEGVGVIFVWSVLGLFTIKLNSGQVKKVDGPGDYFSVLPYMSFFTPDRGKLLSLARID